MGKVLDSIDNELADWLHAQAVFFVATAPNSAEGHINCSPKGGDCFRVLGPLEAAYLDYTGSGVETVAHLRENGRIVLMFCAFSGKPNIVRLHGRGEVVTPEHGDWESLSAMLPENPGARAVIRVRVARVSSSCGFAVIRQSVTFSTNGRKTRGAKGWRNTARRITRGASTVCLGYPLPRWGADDRTQF